MLSVLLLVACQSTVDDVPGCTYETALNYNPEATIDDGSCVFEEEVGTVGCHPVQFDAYTYDVVEIGEQCWFAESLRTTIYSDGTPIPAAQESSDWSSMQFGARCYYPNMVSTWGRMYNAYAVHDTSGLCPSGWHVPTKEEWEELETYLNAFGFPDVETEALKAGSTTSGWSPQCAGTDNFEFSALPSRYRYQEGAFNDAEQYAYYWTSSVAIDYWTMNFACNNASFFFNQNPAGTGGAVRCIAD